MSQQTTIRDTGEAAATNAPANSATSTSTPDNRFGLDLDFTEGMRFDKGYIAPYFVTNADDQTAVLEDPYILLTGQGNFPDGTRGSSNGF